MSWQQQPQEGGPVSTFAVVSYNHAFDKTRFDNAKDS